MIEDRTAYLQLPQGLRTKVFKALDGKESAQGIGDPRAMKKALPPLRAALEEVQTWERDRELVKLVSAALRRPTPQKIGG